MTKWISVKDKLPTDLEEVMFFYTIDQHKKDIVCGHLENGIWHICYLYTSMKLGNLVNVTHWMPLPEEPSVDQPWLIDRLLEKNGEKK